jgi:hypothetical protein
MPRTPKTEGNGLPFDGSRPEYVDLKIGDAPIKVERRTFERFTVHYASHYQAEQGTPPDLGILLSSIINAALDTDKKFVKKEEGGQFKGDASGGGRGASKGASKGGPSGAASGGGGQGGS